MLKQVQHDNVEEISYIEPDLKIDGVICRKKWSICLRAPMSFRTCFGISRLIGGGMGNKIGAEAPIFIWMSGKRRLADVTAGSFGGTMCFLCDDAPVIQVAVAPPGGYPTTPGSVPLLPR